MSNPYPFTKGRPRPPPPDHATIMQAAQVLASAAGSTRNTVIVVGPLGEPQMYDLSSSSESGSSNGNTSPRRLSSAEVSVTGTPTRVAGKAEVLIDSPTLNTDWVEYGEPVKGLEDAMEFSTAGSDSGESMVPLDTPIDTPVEEDDNTDWVALKMQVLQLERSKRAPLRVQTRPFAQERLIPIELPIEFRSPPVLVPQPPPQILRPLTPPSSGSFNSSSTAVSNDCGKSTKHTQDTKDNSAPHADDEGYVCAACDATASSVFRLLPCGDLVCPSCFSSSVAAVSVTQGVSKCPACLEAFTSFDKHKPSSGGAHVRKVRRKKRVEEPNVPGGTVVMRIDNVAWDIEPHIVEAFLPPNTLPLNHPQPVHICLDRKDGRTKDYMYIEVASTAAARRVLQQCQNAFMSGGRVTNGRRRAVTISIVTHDELLKELRPGSNNELLSLLELCEATLTTPPPQLRLDTSGRGRLHASVGQNGKIHYIKYRHAPFHALMSIMCKLRGPQSPAYWDIFRAASSAIAVLANCIKSRDGRAHPADRVVLARLIGLFDACFAQATRLIQP